MKTMGENRPAEAGGHLRGAIRGTLLLVLAAAVIAVAAVDAAAALRNVQPGTAVPEFTLSDGAGTSRSLSDFSGKAKLVIFFSGNDRSKKVMESVEPLYQKYKGDGFEVIAIYTGSDRAEAKTMAEGAKATYPVLLDSDKTAYSSWGVSVTPVMAFVGKDGTMLKEQPYVPLLEGILDIEVQVTMGKMTRQEADLKLKPEEAPAVSESEKEADKIYNLGLVLLERGMKDKAMEKFMKVLEVDPAYCAVRLQLGQLYLEDQNTDKAKAEFEYVLKCDPTSHEAKVGMGTVLGLAGEYDKAIEMIQSSLQLNPRPELAYYELGKVFEKKGQLDKAVENYKLALQKLLAK